MTFDVIDEEEPQTQDIQKLTHSLQCVVGGNFWAPSQILLCGSKRSLCRGPSQLSRALLV